MDYLKSTKNDKYTLKVDESIVANWHVDSSFVVHPDMWSHTEIRLTFVEKVSS